MERIYEYIKIGIAAVGGAIAYVFGPFDGLIIALIAAVALDYATGVAKACVKGELSSEYGFKGLLKKAVIFGVVGLAAMVDRLLPAANEAIRAAAILFYISNEGISLLENAAELGLPLPKGLTDALKQIRKQ